MICFNLMSLLVCVFLLYNVNFLTLHHLSFKYVHVGKAGNVL